LAALVGRIKNHREKPAKNRHLRRKALDRPAGDDRRFLKKLRKKKGKWCKRN